jgi:hypothetical protein
VKNLEESQAHVAELDAKIARAEASLAAQDKISRAASERLDTLHERALAILSETRPIAPPSTGGGWTVETLKQHFDALRAADERFYNERDRRYTEVSVEREKALKIKDEADKAALGLAREIQTYKDEKANELREQIGSERGLYGTKEDVVALGRELRAEFKGSIDQLRAEIGNRAITATAANRWTVERWMAAAAIVLSVGLFLLREGLIK